MACLEIFFLAIMGGAIAQFARRRGGAGFPFVAAAIAGYFVFGAIAGATLGLGPNLLVAAGWVALVFGSVFVLVGDGKRAQGAWQCPDCHFYHEPSTLVCGCGRRYDSF